MPKSRRKHKPTAPPASDPRKQRREESRAEDHEIIHEALRGDDLAFKRLMNKYHDAIFNFIYRMIRDREQVEDLTQEAFIKAFSSLRSFNEEYAFSTWLYKIATNNCIDYIRKRKLQMYSIDKPIKAKDSDYTFELPDDTYQADKEIISGQRTLLLRNAIEQLPEKYRRVIELRHTEEKTYEEIAATLELPIGTVKAHIFRARELLYKQLRRRIRNY
ncbi:MAG: sigma-70 family RNA polymerase sigma factor [Bacteroidetes bacterium]|nr:sigma-70 family RNA polymerase sigma factor [Bacteroidota bacterium]